MGAFLDYAAICFLTVVSSKQVSTDHILFKPVTLKGWSWPSSSYENCLRRQGAQQVREGSVNHGWVTL